MPVIAIVDDNDPFRHATASFIRSLGYATGDARLGGARKVSVVWTGSNPAIAAGLESRGICVADARRAG